MEIRLRYGSGEQRAQLPDASYAGEIAVARDLPAHPDPTAGVARALREPIGAPLLGTMAGPGKRVVIVVNDHTRPTPTRLLLGPVLDELARAGVRDDDITVVFGCGTHRPVRPEEAEAILGSDIIARYANESHRCRARDLVMVGTTRNGNDVFLNRTVVEADLRILTGDIEYHYFAGYSGGRKSILPAVAGADTIQRNHALMLDPRSTTGNLADNPLHLEMVEAARMACCEFIVNTVINTERRVVDVFAGELEQAHLAGVGLLDRAYKVRVERPADVLLVSAGGSPKDIDLYQGFKAVDAAVRAVRPGGAIVALLEAPDGYGNGVFDEWAHRHRSLEELEHRVRTDFVLGGHKAYYIRRYDRHARVFLVSSLPRAEVEDVLGLVAARDLQDGLDRALQHVGRDARVMVMPDGEKVLPVPAGPGPGRGPH
jgi:nickel-dependent lactate racemase